MNLCASRAFWLVACPNQGHEMLFDAHTRNFAALCGIPRRGICDNMKTAVDKVKKGKCRAVNERFETMSAIIYYRYLAPFRAEPLSNSLADTARSSRYDYRYVCQSTHLSLP